VGGIPTRPGHRQTSPTQRGTDLSSASATGALNTDHARSLIPFKGGSAGNPRHVSTQERGFGDGAAMRCSRKAPGA